MFFSFHYFNFSWYFNKCVISVFGNNDYIFFAWRCCVHWSLISKCNFIWILFWINALRCIWLFICFINRHILSLRFNNLHFSRNFRNDLVSNFSYYNNIFLSRCCCIYRSFVSKLCIFREGFRINTSFNSWLFFIFIYWHKLWVAFNNTYCRWYFN